ncbi:hypothetical protein ACF3NG_10095 [Aerococcaceae bacterium WGS1372]
MYNDLLNYQQTEQIIAYEEFRSQFGQSDQVKLERLKDRRSRLQTVVNSFSTPLKEIIKGKYFENKTLYEIADEVKFSYQYVRQLHGNFIKYLKELDKYIKY